MFPLKAKDELVFGILPNNDTTTSTSISFTTPSQTSLLQDHVEVLDHAATQYSCTSNITFSSKNPTEKPRMNRRPRGGEGETKKASHRDIERQRRQEMSQLYASLRSLLPLDHINKGKQHSLSDLMHDSKNYIEKLQNNVQELGARRDKLKKIYVTSSSSGVVGSSGNNDKPNIVEVNQVQNRVEILITGGSEYILSGVMIELMNWELNVMNCISTKIDGRFLHKIQVEAEGDERPVDLLRLQERLTDRINFKDDATN